MEDVSTVDFWHMGRGQAAPPHYTTVRIAKMFEEEAFGPFADESTTLAKDLVSKVFVPSGAATVEALSGVHKLLLLERVRSCDLDPDQWLKKLRRVCFGESGDDFPMNLRSGSSALSDSSTCRSIDSMGRAASGSPLNPDLGSQPLEKHSCGHATTAIGGMDKWFLFNFPEPGASKLREYCSGSPNMTGMLNFLFKANACIFETTCLDTMQKTRYASICHEYNASLIEADLTEAIRVGFSNRRQGRFTTPLVLNPMDVNDYIIQVSSTPGHLYGKFDTSDSEPRMFNFKFDTIEERAKECLAAGKIRGLSNAHVKRAAHRGPLDSRASWQRPVRPRPRPRPSSSIRLRSSRHRRVNHYEEHNTPALHAARQPA